MVTKLARKQNENLQKYVLNYQAIKVVFKAKSSDQGIFSSIKNGRRWFYKTTIVTIPCIGTLILLVSYADGFSHHPQVIKGNLT